jgi:hypothetical protein
LDFLQEAQAALWSGPVIERVHALILPFIQISLEANECSPDDRNTPELRGGIVDGVIFQHQQVCELRSRVLNLVDLGLVPTPALHLRRLLWLAIGSKARMFLTRHVFGQGGEVKIVLEGPGGIRLDWVAGVSRGDLRRVMQEAERERERLIAMWRRIHGR